MFLSFLLSLQIVEPKMKRSNSESNSENEDNLNDVTNMSSGGGSNASGGGGGGGGGGNNNNNRGGQKRFRKEETIRLLIPSRVSWTFFAIKHNFDRFEDTNYDVGL